MNPDAFPAVQKASAEAAVRDIIGSEGDGGEGEGGESGGASAKKYESESARKRKRKTSRGTILQDNNRRKISTVNLLEVTRSILSMCGDDCVTADVLRVLEDEFPGADADILMEATGAGDTEVVTCSQKWGKCAHVGVRGAHRVVNNHLRAQKLLRTKEASQGLLRIWRGELPQGI